AAASADAAYAAADAADASAYAASADAASADAASAAVWQAVVADARAIEAGLDPLTQPLWPGDIPKDFLKAEIEGLERLATETGDRNSFWHRWWFAMKRGEPMDWALQRDVALIPEEIWQQGAKAVGVEIAKIEERYKNLVTASQAELLLHAALADYTFDAMNRVMRMVPFEEDIRHLRDPVRLADFLDDADALRDDLELFSRALAAEGAMQHAGFARTYLDGILDEFSRARQMNHLRVGRVVEHGKILEGYAASPEVAAEFGPAIHALKSHVQSLLDLTRRHFAATMTRMAPLRDLTTGPEDDQWTLLQDIQRGIKAMAAPPSSDLRPLAADDVNVLLSMAESIEKLLRQNDVVAQPQSRSSLRREIDHGLALLSVSVALYLEKARAEGHGAGKVLDWISTQYKRTTGLIGLWALIRKLWS
nr:hypothetical protein [Tabrizicola sp.]